MIEQNDSPLKKITKHLLNASGLKGAESLKTDFELIYLGFVSSQVYEDMDGKERELMLLLFLELHKTLEQVSLLKIESVESETILNIDYKAKYEETKLKYHLMKEELISLTLFSKDIFLKLQNKNNVMSKN